jgi:nitrite reductase/ring-hydroxylating ferredoxin subunit
METPDSVKAIGEQLAAGGKIDPAAELFDAYPVFAAELQQIFTRPWLAVDHASRLAADGDYFRADVGSRSVVLVREAADRIHALRNACLHAGYRVCEEEAGHGEQLFCQYHGWYYALDGRLTDPYLRPDQEDRSRFRLPRYAMQIRHGLILVDLSAIGPEPPPAGPVELGAIPAALAEGTVAERRRYPTTWNWKHLRHFLWSSPELFCGGACDHFVEVGPMSFVALRGNEAALVRLAPRFPGHSDFELVRITANGAVAPAEQGDADPVAEALREAGERTAATPLERGFYEWYWSLMAPASSEVQ